MEYLVGINLVLTLALLVIVLRQFRPRQKMTREAFEKALEVAAGGLAEAREYFEIEKARNQSRPIHHDPVQGPTTSTAAGRSMSYWRRKDDPKAEPFLAWWFEHDTTSGINGPLPDPQEVIPADTYIDPYMGGKMPGPKFRSMYEPAPAVMEVAKLKPKSPLHNTTLVQGRTPGVPMSEEEEARLAEEYELGGQTTDG